MKGKSVNSFSIVRDCAESEAIVALDLTNCVRDALVDDDSCISSCGHQSMPAHLSVFQRPRRGDLVCFLEHDKVPFDCAIDSVNKVCDLIESSAFQII